MMGVAATPAERPPQPPRRGGPLTKVALFTMVATVKAFVVPSTLTLRRSSRAKGSLVICKCHLCNAYLYPGDKRYRLKIWICPDSEEDLSTATQECFQEIGQTFLPDCEENPWFEPLEEEEPESCQEASLVLCKSCQDRLLRNPVFREHLLFPAQEYQAKRIH